jgi:hypothetical protein
MGPLTLPTVAAATLIAFPSLARANVGVFSGSGHTVKLSESAEVQLVRERVEIHPHRGPRLFAGGAPVDRVDFDCTFELRNLSDQAVAIQVGFPLDSQFLSRPYDPKAESETADLVHEYGFIARDDSRTYHTSFQPYTESYGSTFLWSMDFAPGETRTLRVSYGMDMSSSLGDMLVQGEDREEYYKTALAARKAVEELPWLQHQNGAIAEGFQYITATGASWAGTIERAEFIVYTWQFEEYLSVRAPIEVSPLDDGRGASMFGNYPTRFTRDIRPTGYESRDLKAREGKEASLKWTYAPFDAGEPLVGRYLKSAVPSTAEGALVFCRKLVEEHSADLNLVRQYFAAWMGSAPIHETLRSYCATQRWYKPVDDWRMDDLGEADRAILVAIDQLIQEAK